MELSKPVSVSDTQQFKEYALKSFGVIDPTYHPCLVSLPAIFLRAMKGVSAIVDAYLGRWVGGVDGLAGVETNKKRKVVELGKDSSTNSRYIY